jgi:hypothetical protein
MDATFRLFPWDVDGDRTAAARLRELGVTRVALAATYHGARLITPRHPRHRIVDLPASASYTAEASPLPRGRFSFERARDALCSAGIAVETWAVVGHLDGDSDGVPRVVNAFGDRLEHAPCLTQASSREVLHGIVRAAARVARGGMLHLEALGWQSLDHGGLHDKLHGADLDERGRELLQLCTCTACAADLDVDRADLEAAVRWALDTGADAGAGGTVVEAALRHRADVATGLAGELVAAAAAAGVTAVSLSVEDAGALDRSDAGQAGERPVVERLVDCWGGVDRGIAALDRASGGTAYVDVLSGDPAAFASHWRRLAEHGADRLHVYHAGLASTARLQAAIAAVSVAARVA